MYSNAKNFSIQTSTHSQTETLEMLLEGADVIVRPPYGYSLLSNAATRGQASCVKLLLDAGAKMNGDLLKAAIKGHDKCVELLLNAGADVNEKGYNTIFLVEALDESNEEDIPVEVLINLSVKDTVKKSAMMYAAEEGFYKCVKLLVKAGADVNDITTESMTPLMFACKSLSNKDRDETGLVDYDECVRLLVLAGANVICADKTGKTALHYASQSENKESFRLLLDAGAGVIRNHRNLDHAFTKANLPDDFSLNPYDGSKKWSKCNSSHCNKISFGCKSVSSLTEICKTFIREHLIFLNPEVNLFVTVPNLGLPKLLIQYLLQYYVQ